jgi:hypothetical protein
MTRRVVPGVLTTRRTTWRVELVPEGDDGAAARGAAAAPPRTCLSFGTAIVGNRAVGSDSVGSETILAGGDTIALTVATATFV